MKSYAKSGWQTKDNIIKSPQIRIFVIIIIEYYILIITIFLYILLDERIYYVFNV